jgi:hypothetical protein
MTPHLADQLQGFGSSFVKVVESLFMSRSGAGPGGSHFSLRTGTHRHQGSTKYLRGCLLHADAWPPVFLEDRNDTVCVAENDFARMVGGPHQNLFRVVLAHSTIDCRAQEATIIVVLMRMLASVAGIIASPATSSDCIGWAGVSRPIQVISSTRLCQASSASLELPSWRMAQKRGTRT